VNNSSTKAICPVSRLSYTMYSMISSLHRCGVYQWSVDVAPWFPIGQRGAAAILCQQTFCTQCTQWSILCAGAVAISVDVDLASGRLPNVVRRPYLCKHALCTHCTQWTLLCAGAVAISVDVVLASGCTTWCGGHIMPASSIVCTRCTQW
jgi:hypothetical protein